MPSRTSSSTYENGAAAANGRPRAASEATPASLSTYTRSMHLYTSAQMAQMRSAINNAAQTANNTIDEGHARELARRHSSRGIVTPSGAGAATKDFGDVDAE